MARNSFPLWLFNKTVKVYLNKVFTIQEQKKTETRNLLNSHHFCFRLSRNYKVRVQLRTNCTYLDQSEITRGSLLYSLKVVYL